MRDIFVSVASLAVASWAHCLKIFFSPKKPSSSEALCRRGLMLTTPHHFFFF